MDLQPTLTMGAVAFAPSNASVMYAASVEDAAGYNPAWSGVGVLGPEAFDAAPFLQLLEDYGSPWGMREQALPEQALRTS